MPDSDLDRILRQPGTVLLDTARPDAENRQSLLFAHPLRVLAAPALADVPALLDAVDAAVEQGRYVAGYLAYEAGYAFERIAPLGPADGPLGWFGVYEAPALLGATTVEQPAPAAFSLANVRFGLDRPAYLDRIAAIRRHIREGDVYQINFTDALTFDFGGDPYGFFCALRRRQRVSYGAFVNTGDACILSLSPELFFRRDGDRVVARPMKGTVRRGRTPAEDEALARWLAADEKSRAENLMIVDLLRNDLSVVCTPGSVRVPHLFATERYNTLIQMTSTVEGRLRAGTGYADLFRALFPCGSVTGAPKIRAMQCIHALERGPRGVYCGAVGYAAPGAEAVFNVAIRTVVLRGGQGRMGVGSGIVWDSDAGAEYDECLLKAQFLTQPHKPEPGFALLETMRWDGAIALLALHADRLRASAAHFEMPFDEAGFRAAVDAAVRGLPRGAVHKVRVTLDPAGRFGVTTARLPDEPPAPLRVVLAGERLDSHDAMRYHKTTRRAPYEAAYLAARAAGFDEALFLNERGEVAEGTRTNVFIRVGTAWFTPPVASGLLPGVYRRHLLETLARASERVLTVDDLCAADALYLCNAVRGLVAAVLVPERVPALQESA